MKYIYFHPEAEKELNSSIDFYNLKVSGLGLEFLSQIERAVDQIEQNPLFWKIKGRNIRQYILKQFPYSIFYVIDPTQIHIVAIAHQKRKPFYWKTRL